MERIVKYQKPEERKAEQKAKKKADKAAILQANNDAFLSAHEAAKQHGIVLTRFTGGHFRLLNRKAEWVIDIWPAQRRIVPKGPAPKVVVGDGWTLIEIVEAVCKQEDT